MKGRMAALIGSALVTTTALAASPYPTSATTNWQLQLNAYCPAAPAVAPDGTVYLLQNGCNNSLLSVSPGKTTNWQATLCHNNYGAPAIGADGTLYVAGQNATNKDCLLAVNPANGSTLWSFPFSSSSQRMGGAPAIGADGTVYICYLSQVFAITNGALAWTYPTNNTFGTVFQYSSPAVAADGTIYVFGSDATLYALNPDGTLKWAVAAPGFVYYIQPSPTIGGDGTIYCGDTGNFFALNPDGTFKWTNAIPDQDFQLEAQVGSDGTIYVESEAIGSLTTTLYAFRPDGSVKWTFPRAEHLSFYEYYLPFQASSCALAANGEVYTVDTFGTLYSLAPNGTTNWSYATGIAGLKSPVLGPDGTLYVVNNYPDAGGQFYLFSFRGAAPIACSSWPEHRKNGRNTAAVTPAWINAAAWQTNGLQLSLSGTTNVPACICASTNLVNWTNLGSVVLLNGTANFTDPAATNSPSRFYHALPQ